MRALFVLAGGSVLTAWFVSLGVAASIGASDPVAQVANIGPLPTPPPSLGVLQLPRRDPFAADPASAAGAPAVVNRAPGIVVTTVPGAGSSTIARQDVPDIAAFTRRGPNGGVIAVMISDHDAYALVEDGSDVHVARVGDSFAGSTIVSIASDVVVLANGDRVMLDAKRDDAPAGSAGADVAGPAAPSVVEPSFAGANESRPRPAVAGRVVTGMAVRAPRGPAAGPTALPASSLRVSGFGQPVLSMPDGSAPTSPPSSALGPAFGPALSPASSLNPSTVVPGGHL